jgi:hypothetical protein
MGTQKQQRQMKVTPLAKRKTMDFRPLLGIAILASCVLIRLLFMDDGFIEAKVPAELEKIKVLLGCQGDKGFASCVHAAEMLATKNVPAATAAGQPVYTNAAAYIRDFRKYVMAVDFTTYGTDDNGNPNTDLWTAWEEQGVHVLPMHYYTPIVSTKELQDHYAKPPYSTKGIDFNHDFQRRMVEEMTTTYKKELSSFPALPPGGDISKSLTYAMDNPTFGLYDASLYHTIIRHFKPGYIIEVGSGQSLKVSMAAATINSQETNSPKAGITVIEPFPDQVHNSHLLSAKDITTLIVKKVQDMDLDIFRSLKKNDILFLDSSHTVGSGTDTVHEILNILPELAPGVIVHIHDIFLPSDLPSDWIVDHHRVWAEQYLLQAFLMFNKEFEVLGSNVYMMLNFKSVFAERMPEQFQSRFGASFWFRRKLSN